MTVSGVRAELRCGPMIAATLGRWSILDAGVMGDSPIILTATVIHYNEFWMSHATHDVWLEMADGVAWVWRRVGVQRGEAMVVSAKMYGSPEVRVL